jgi:small-conductance mechanosensitive channel
MRRFTLLFKLFILIGLTIMSLESIAISDLLPPLKPKYRDTIDFYGNTVIALAIFLLILDFIQVGLVKLYKKRNHIKHDDNFVIGVSHIYNILMVGGLFIGLLSLFKVEVKELFTSISIVFAGLAILTKDYVANMLSGMIITFSGHLRIGDQVMIGKHKGKIMDLTLQNIHLRNEDDDYVYIPCNTVFFTDVINYTKMTIKRTSIEFEVNAKNLESVEHLEKTLIETLEPFHDKIDPESYYLRVAEILKDRVLLKFQYILKDPNRDLERIIRRKTVRRVVQIVAQKEKEKKSTE